MMFLTWLDDVLQALAQIVGDILNIIWGILCWVVYPLMSWLFSIFTRLSSVDILKEDIIEGIYGRVTIILTIVMTFYIVFEFVKYTVSPDTITDKDKGAMPLFVRIVLVIIMLALVPKIFSGAMILQQKVINSNIIPRIILGTVHNNGDVYGPGREFVGDVYSAFIVVDCENPTLFGTCEGLKAEVYKNIETIKRGNPLAFMYSSTITQFSQGIEFHGLLALIFGGFMVYVLFIYCKDIALRHIQLLFLQIIAPVAIMSYISPKKDGMFQKWLKQCTTTYLDLFIRVAVLYFMILVCDILGETFQLDQLQTTVDGTDRQISLTLYLFLISGIMMFLKKAPKLLEELFPKSGAASIGFGFSAKDRRGLLNPLDVAARTAGTVAGAMSAKDAIKSGNLLNKDTLNKVSKLGKGATGAYKAATYTNAIFRAGASGFKAGKDGKFGEAIKAGQSKIHEYESLVQAGGTVLGHDFGAGKAQNTAAKYQLQIDLLKNMETSKGDVNKAIGEIKFRKQMDAVAASLQASGNVAAKVAWDGKIKEFEKLARNYADGSINSKRYELETKKMLDSFNSTYFSSDPKNQVNLSTADLEIGSVKYQDVTRNMGNAKTIAQTISKQEIKYETFEVDKNGNFVLDTNGNRKRITKTLEMPPLNDQGQILDGNGNVVYKKDENGNDIFVKDENGNDVKVAKTFADYIGDFTDEVTIAKGSIEDSDEYTMAKKNSEGKKQ